MYHGIPRCQDCWGVSACRLAFTRIWLWMSTSISRSRTHPLWRSSGYSERSRVATCGFRCAGNSSPGVSGPFCVPCLCQKLTILRQSRRDATVTFWQNARRLEASKDQRFCSQLKRSSLTTLWTQDLIRTTTVHNLFVKWMKPWWTLMKLWSADCTALTSHVLGCFQANSRWVFRQNLSWKQSGKSIFGLCKQGRIMPN